VRWKPLVLTGVAAFSILAGCTASTTHVSEGSAPFVAPAGATTTVPGPATAAGPVAPTTTVPLTATAVRSATVRVCSPLSTPQGGAATELATPDAANLAYSASAGGPPVGHVTNPWGGPSTRPVANQQNGWVEIPLYSRPNGSMGWVPAQEVSLTSTTYSIVVSICQRTLTLFQGADPVYSAPVGVGRPQWPTPVGPTFVDAIVTTPRREVSIYGPTVLMLGTHSNVFTDFDGGDGVVAIHGYPSDEASTDGVASSHGCVRASPTTIDTVKNVPVGTPVDVVA
jgi:hypothetical protein